MKNSPVKTPFIAPPVSSSDGETMAAGDPQNFRRLKWDELVRAGDFVKDGREGFEPWEGPPGFRAASFVKVVYRLQTPQLAGAGKIA